MTEGSRIQKLDDVVINRIAAGEVVQRPCNAIKELIENSIDAVSDTISVTVDDGGLKFLQITDSGHGIRKADLTIVCERFTTSKLRTFSDLKAINTHGFRGEALASISHVSHVNILTKTAEEKCAWTAYYKDGKLHPKKPGMPVDPKPCAGNKGTTITAQDLFYNMPTRKRAMTGRDEFNKIAHVITCYAVHNTGVAFTLKKQGENIPKLRTTATASRLDTISNLFGPSLGKELIEVRCEDKNFAFKSQGYLSNANYSGKAFRFILFINNRLVESTAAKKAFESTYASVLPKNSYPFVYLSIEIDPQNIDVNVHPTKNEVHFLNEDAIIAGIQAKAEQTLYKCSTSRNYYMQARLPGVNPTLDTVLKASKNDENATPKTVYDHELVRIDCNQMKLDTFLANNPAPLCNAPSSDNISSEISSPSLDKIISAHPKQESIFTSLATEASRPDFRTNVEKPGSSKSRDTTNAIENKENIDIVNVEKYVANSSEKAAVSAHRPPVRRHIYLSSILELQEDICKSQHGGATDILRHSQFVGIASTKYALAQVKTKLHLFDFGKLSEMLFYQKVIFDFQNFDVYKFTEPAPLQELISLALEDKESSWNPDHGSKEELAEFAVELLKSKREMLDDYFSVRITEEGDLVGLPLLLEQYYPMLHHIPMFLLRVATEVQWDAEKPCFQSLARELAHLYSMRPPEYENESLASTQAPAPTQETDPNVRNWKFTVEHVLFPQFKAFLQPDEQVSSDGSILQIADLHDLYKVFERC